MHFNSLPLLDAGHPIKARFLWGESLKIPWLEEIRGRDGGDDRRRREGRGGEGNRGEEEKRDERRNGERREGRGKGRGRTTLSQKPTCKQL